MFLVDMYTVCSGSELRCAWMHRGRWWFQRFCVWRNVPKRLL